MRIRMEIKVAELFMLTSQIVVSFCIWCEIRFITMERAGDREILRGSAQLIWISAPRAASVPD